MKTQAPASLTVTVPVSPAYQNEYLAIEEKAVTLVLPLLDGPHTLTSELVQVGALRNFGKPGLLASCSVWYSFDAATNCLELCGSELVSEKSSCVTTFLSGIGQPHQQPAYAVRPPVGPDALLWNPDSPLTPGLAQELQTISQAITSALLQKALELGLTVVQLAPPPLLSAAQYKQLCPVYHQGRFVEFYDESKTYGADYIIGDFQSVYKGLATFATGQHYANIIGSTDDPKHGEPSWIALWRKAYKVANPTNCSSYHFSGTPGGGPITTPFDCRGRWVGGHVILSDYAAEVAHGSDNIFIIPICNAHNSNNKIYMEPVHDNRAIVLSNYFKMSEGGPGSPAS